MIKKNFKYLTILLSLILASPVSSEYSAAIGYKPKYPENFTHFDYVNPYANKGGEIKLSAFGTFESLNPFLLKSLAPVGMNELIFETLMERSLDEPSSSYGHIAEKFILSKDKLSVIYIINEKARFSNNDLITAEDIKFSFEMLTSTSAHPQYKIYWSDIKKVEVINNQTIKFHFKKTNPELHMIVGDIPIFSKKWIVNNNFGKTILNKPIASGPYIIDKYEFGRYIVYKKNPNYWAEKKPTRRGMFNFDTIVFKYYKDMTVALEAFKGGEYDFIFENHSKRWARDYNGPKFKSNEIIKKELVHQNNAGIQGFIFNTRKEMFKNKDVRKAITLAFDFSWSNKNLFYNQYERCKSYFSNSELSSMVKPSLEEFKLANELNISSERLQNKEILSNPVTPKEMRANLIKAKAILDRLGWKVIDNILYDDKGNKIEFNFLLAQKGFERILAPFAENLKKLGIVLHYRTIDLSLYQRRVDTFDYDMMVMSYPQSQSPGNELISMFHSSTVNKKGSYNLAGINDSDVDKVLSKIIYNSNRDELINAAHLLDRLLWNEYYMLPNWYINKHRIAYFDKFEQPETLPKFFEATNYVLKTWWYK